MFALNAFSNTFSTGFMGWWRRMVMRGGDVRV